MYLRWKRRALRRAWERTDGRKDYRFEAVIVESHRIAGKRRQQALAYLGSLREDDIEDTDARIRFWDTVDAKLATLALTTAARVALESALDRRVTRPSSDERAAAAELRSYWQAVDRAASFDNLPRPTPTPRQQSLIDERKAHHRARDPLAVQFERLVRRRGQEYRINVLGLQLRSPAVRERVLGDESSS
jgi:hypothetical protein